MMGVETLMPPVGINAAAPEGTSPRRINNVAQRGPDEAPERPRRVGMLTDDHERFFSKPGTTTPGVGLATVN